MPEVLQYVFESTTWSLGGLILGFALGRMERKVEKIDVEVQQVVSELEHDS